MTKNRITVLAACLLPVFVCGAQQKSVSLEECLELSHSGNPDVVNAALDVNAAKARKKEAAASRFPTASLSAYGFRALDPLVDLSIGDLLGQGDAANNVRYYAESMGIQTQWPFLQNGYAAALNVSQPLYAGGRIANGNALASLGIEAAQLQGRMALRDNDDRVEEKYWTIVSLSEKKKALEHGISLLESLEKDVLSAVDAGLAKESDLMQVRLKLNGLQAQMGRLRNGERLAKMDLFNGIGMDYKVLDLDSIVLSDGFDGLSAPDSYYRDESEVAASMDESRLLELSVQSKKLERKMAVGEALPEIGIGATMGYGKVIGDPRSNGAVYAMVKIPLSDWSKTARKAKRAQYEIEKAENDKDYLDKQLLLKVNKEWMDLQCAWDSKLNAEDAVALSELLESQKRGEYEAGLCTMSELLQCQTELQSARSGLVDALSAYRTALSVWMK